MFIDSSLWKSLLFLFSASQSLVVTGNQRENLALRHPCNSINKRLGPYIKWTERLASSQYGVLKDACGQTGSGPTCCTNEIVNSYAVSLGHDLKLLFDAELGQLRELLSRSKEHVDRWAKVYVSETRHITISSVEQLFGQEEYRSNIHHSLVTLFNILGDQHSSTDDVSKSAVALFNQLIISSYRRFMTQEQGNLELDEQFQKCLINKAFSIKALPTQPELLYTLTGGASLIHILQTLFVYLDADIQRMNETASLTSHQCIQRYARETLCPICVRSPSPWSLSNNYDDEIDEPLCENDCRYVVKTCFDQTNNPYVAFAFAAQGYARVIKQIQEAAVELKLVERLAKVHIYLYDMVINATNTQKTYMELQAACPRENSKPFSPIQSLQPITSERRELVARWNSSLHLLLNELHGSISQLNVSLTEHVMRDICSKTNYATKSQRCTQIDQHTPGNLTQWPLPPVRPSLESSFSLHNEQTRDQLNELEKKITPVQNVIISLRPRKIFSLFENVPDFEFYDDDLNTTDHDGQSPLIDVESYDNDPQEPLSNRLYKAIDGSDKTRGPVARTTEPPEEIMMNSSQSLTYTITFFTVVFSFLFIHRISFTSQ